METNKIGKKATVEEGNVEIVDKQTLQDTSPTKGAANTIADTVLSGDPVSQPVLIAASLDNLFAATKGSQSDEGVPVDPRPGSSVLQSTDVEPWESVSQASLNSESRRRAKELREKEHELVEQEAELQAQLKRIAIEEKLMKVERAKKRVQGSLKDELAMTTGSNVSSPQQPPSKKDRSADPVFVTPDAHAQPLADSKPSSSVREANLEALPPMPSFPLGTVPRTTRPKEKVYGPARPRSGSRNREIESQPYSGTDNKVPETDGKPSAPAALKLTTIPAKTREAVEALDLEKDLASMIEEDFPATRPENLTPQRKDLLAERQYLIDQCVVQTRKLQMSDRNLAAMQSAIVAAENNTACVTEGARSSLQVAEQTVSDLMRQLAASEEAKTLAENACNAATMALHNTDERIMVAVSAAQNDAVMKHKTALAHVSEQYDIMNEKLSIQLVEANQNVDKMRSQVLAERQHIEHASEVERHRVLSLIHI